MIKTDIAVVIPALNEETNIERVVRSVADYATPLVVDDGSTDQTSELAQLAGAIVVIHPLNLGYDSALSSGLEMAFAKGFEYAVTMDADGQHNPSILKEFICAFDAGSDLVLGVRNRRQRFGEDIFALWARFLWKIKDPLCGMKGYRLSLLKKYGPFDSRKSVGSEFAIRLVQNGIQFVEVPVVTRQRIGASRFGDGWQANYKILSAMVRVTFRKK